jgi:hypothetical protein
MKKSGGLLVALASVLLFIWLGSQLTFKEVSVPARLRGEAAHNPFHAAILLSRTLGAEARWEQVFVEPPRRSVLVLSGWNWSLSRARRERIEQWVEDGGRLVVDNWLLGDLSDFERWSGITNREIAAEQTADLSCTDLAEDGNPRHYEVCGTDPLNSLHAEREVQWALRQGERIEALRVAVGRGSVTAVNATPFRFRAFLQGDHMQLFLAATQLHRNDTVLFLTEDEQASLPALVWRFGAPAVLLLLAALALALWRAGTSFGPRVAAADAARRSLAEQIRGTGQFVARVGSGRALHGAANRALRDAARRRIHDYERLSSEERVVALAKATGLGLGDLAHAVNFSGARSSHELRHAIAVLESARRQLLTKRPAHGN